MNKIPTAEEFLSDNIDRTHFPFIDEAIEDKQGDVMTIIQCMEEYSKLKAEFYIEAALKAAAENAEINFDDKIDGTVNISKWRKSDSESITVNEASILNAYPKELIK